MCNKKRRKKMKKLSQFLKSHISGICEAISLKFGMWSAAVGGHVHSKNRLVSSRKHRATEVQKLRFLSSCQYTHGCYARASWAARHTTMCLDSKSAVTIMERKTMECFIYGYYNSDKISYSSILKTKPPATHIY